MAYFGTDTEGTTAMTEKTEDRPAVWPVSTHLSPRACGTCRGLHLLGKAVEHEACAMRAVLAKAPDHPDYEALLDLTYEQRQQLPARFHVPVWDGDGVPHAWLCAVCWDDGEVCRWPCSTAARCGGEVFERT